MRGQIDRVLIWHLLLSVASILGGCSRASNSSLSESTSLGYLDGEMHVLTEHRRAKLESPVWKNSHFNISNDNVPGVFGWSGTACMIARGCEGLHHTVAFERLGIDISGRSNYRGPVWRKASGGFYITGKTVIAPVGQIPSGKTVISAKLFYAVIPSFQRGGATSPYLDGGASLRILCVYDQIRSTGELRRKSISLATREKKYGQKMTTWQFEDLDLVTSPLDLKQCERLGANAEIVLAVGLNYSKAAQFGAVELTASQIVN